MKAIQAHDQTKVLKSQLATALRQFSDLNRLCPQYPGADCEDMFTERTNLYKEVKRIGRELKEMSHSQRIKPLQGLNRSRSNVRRHSTIDFSQQNLGT